MHRLSAEKKICIVLITPLVNQPENMAGLVLDVVIRLFRWVLTFLWAYQIKIKASHVLC